MLNDILKIGVDIDGVIADLVSAMLPLLSKACGYNVTHADITKYDIGKALNIEKHMGGIWKAVYTDEFLIKVPLIDGSLNGLGSIPDQSIIFITGRPEPTRSITDMWLKNNNIDSYELRFSTKGKHLNCDGIDVFIDDYYEEASNVSATGIPTLLFDQPWNQGPVDGNMKRVKDWTEITEYITRMSNN